MAKYALETHEQYVTGIRRLEKQIYNLIMVHEDQHGKTDISLALRAAEDMLLTAELILTAQEEDGRLVNALDRATMNMKGIYLYEK